MQESFIQVGFVLANYHCGYGLLITKPSFSKDFGLFGQLSRMLASQLQWEFTLGGVNLPMNDMIMSMTDSNIAAISTIKRERNSCGCGGHTARAALNPAFDLRSIRALSFAEPAHHQCNCGRACPRKYLSLTGFALGGFLATAPALLLVGIVAWYALAQTHAL